MYSSVSSYLSFKETINIVYTGVCHSENSSAFHTENSSVCIDFKKYGPGISVVNTRNMSNTVIGRHVN